MSTKKRLIFRKIPLSKNGTGTIIVMSNPSIGLKSKQSDGIDEFCKYLKNIIESESKLNPKSEVLNVILMGCIVNPRATQKQTVLNALIQRIKWFHATFYIINSPDVSVFRTFEYLNPKQFIIIDNADAIALDDFIVQKFNLNLMISYNYDSNVQSWLKTSTIDEANEVREAKLFRDSIIDDSQQLHPTWFIFGNSKMGFISNESLIMSIGHCTLGLNNKICAILKFYDDFSIENKYVCSY